LISLPRIRRHGFDARLLPLFYAAAGHATCRFSCHKRRAATLPRFIYAAQYDAAAPHACC